MRIVAYSAAGAVLLSALFSAQATAADATATASIGATVLTPITITKTADLNFGSFAPDKESGGTVVISTAGVRSFTGGTRNVSTGDGTVTAASFTVSGEANANFSITLPTSVNITHTDTTTTMSVGTFVSNPSGSGTLSAGGSATVTVGATLTVAADQKVGVYSNATGLPVTVAYN